MDAPDGSGAPTGTEYHWYILAHQNVRKLDANEYITSMKGVKYKLAHRRTMNEEWSANGRGQLRKLIAILEENIIQLRQELAEGGGSGVMHSEAGSPEGISRRREMTGHGRMRSNGMALGMLGQPPLETYIPQAAAGADPDVLPSIGSSSQSSSKSEFLPKKRR